MPMPQSRATTAVCRKGRCRCTLTAAAGMGWPASSSETLGPNISSAWQGCEQPGFTQTSTLQFLNGSQRHDHMISQGHPVAHCEGAPMPPWFQDAKMAPRLAAMVSQLENWWMLCRGGGPWKRRQRKALPAVLTRQTKF